jgi:hypothetical protein
MVADWYYQKGQREHGPIEAAALLHLAKTGRLSPSDLVRKEGMKAGIPAGRVRGLLFAPPPQVALQPDSVHRPARVVTATPAAVTQEAASAKSNVDWSSALLLSIAFILGAPIAIGVPILLFIFVPVALLFIPLAVLTFLLVGPKKYRSALGRFWSTVCTPRNWRLSTTGAAASVAAGAYLAMFLVASLGRNLSGKRVSMLAPQAASRGAKNESSVRDDLTVGAKGVAIKGKSIPTPFLMTSLVNALGQPSRSSRLPENTIHSWDNVGIIAFQPHNSKCAIALGVFFAPSDLKYAPTTPFAGRLVINGEQLHAGSSVADLQAAGIVPSEPQLGMYRAEVGPVSVNASTRDLDAASRGDSAALVDRLRELQISCTIQSDSGVEKRTVSSSNRQADTKPSLTSSLNAFIEKLERILPKPVTVIYQTELVYKDGPKKGQSFSYWKKRKYLAASVVREKTRIETADLAVVVRGGGDPQTTTHAAMVVVQIPYLEVKADTREEVIAKPFDPRSVQDAGQPGWLWYSGGEWVHSGGYNFHPFNLAAPPKWTAAYLTQKGDTKDVEIID